MKTRDIVRFHPITRKKVLYKFVGYDYSVEGTDCIIIDDECDTEIHANTVKLIFVCAR